MDGWQYSKNITSWYFFPCCDKTRVTPTNDRSNLGRPGIGIGRCQATEYWHTQWWCQVPKIHNNSNSYAAALPQASTQRNGEVATPLKTRQSITQAYTTPKNTILLDCTNKNNSHLYTTYVLEQLLKHYFFNAQNISLYISHTAMYKIRKSIQKTWCNSSNSRTL